MDEFPSVVLDMSMVYAKSRDDTFDHSTYFSTHHDRFVELSDLVSHRKIGVEITLAVEDTPFLYGSTHRMSCAYSEIYDSG